MYESDQDGDRDGGSGDNRNPSNVDSDNGDGGDNGDPPAPRTSNKLNRGVPATRYDDVFELAAEIMSPFVAMALEGVKVYPQPPQVGASRLAGMGVPHRTVINRRMGGI